MDTYDEKYQKSAEITIDGIAYKIKRIDVHHFSMSDKRYPDRSIAIWHIAQLHEDAPYKDDVEKWLKDDGFDVNDNKYNWETAKQKETSMNSARKNIFKMCRQVGKTNTVKAMLDEASGVGGVMCPRCKTTETPWLIPTGKGQWYVCCAQCSATTGLHETEQQACDAWDNKELLNRKQRRSK